jgi:hypothetical protein
MFAFLQLLVVQALSYAAFIGGAWALVDVIRRAPDAFVSAGKQSKNLWLLFVGVATAVLFIAIPYPFGLAVLSIFNFVALAAAVVVVIYPVGVTPALGPHRKGPRGGGRRSNSGGW